MTLTIEQLEVLSKALHSPDLDYHQLSITGEAVRALDMEIERRKHGPFTLAEAVASGKPFKRPGWNDYATVLVDSDDDGYMCFVFVAAGPEPAYAEELLATDYELAEGGD